MTIKDTIEELKQLPIDPHCSRERLCEINEARDRTINVLERRIPQKAIHIDEWRYCCPYCEISIEVEFDTEMEGMSYCQNCGQLIDWGREDADSD